MALIHCPECNKKISDKAASCPNCGCPNPTNADAFIASDASVVDSGSKTKPPRISAAKGIVIILILLVVVGFYLSWEKPSGGSPNVASPVSKPDRYSWAQYLTKSECDGWGTKGATYGEMDRLSGNYDSGGKKRMATSDISLSDNRLSEIWTCFETGYDTAYYKRY